MARRATARCTAFVAILATFTVTGSMLAISATTAQTLSTTSTVETPFVSSFTASRVRNDFTGRVGMRIAIGTSDISAVSLGRTVLSGNAGSHVLSLLDANGAVLRTATVNLAGKSVGSFAYAPLASPVVLKATATYFVLSDETAGADTWYDYATSPVTTAAGQVTAAAYATATGSPVVGGTAAQAYGLVNLTYSSATSTTSTTSPTTSTTAPSTTTTTTTPPVSASTTTTAAPKPTVRLTEKTIRSALDKGGVIQLPAGTVDITKPLRVTKSGTKLLGAGRDATVLRMKFGPNGSGPLLALPAVWSTDFNGGNPPPPSMRVSNVEIAHLSIDGAREGNPNTYGGAQATTVRFGIQSTISTNTWLHDLHVYDIAGDGITFGNGTGVNMNPIVEDVLVERAGRNGLHLGSSDGAVLRRVQALDTPGPYWPNAGAGNGLDIEVEGADPKVVNTRVEDSAFERPSNPGYAGYGIQVARAFGPVDNLTISRNRFKNHQQGILISTASNVVIENNTFESSPAGQNGVTGGGIALISAGTQYSPSTVIRSNRFYFEDWQWFADNIVSVSGPGNWQITDNEMYGAVQVFKAYGDQPSAIQSARNSYRPLNNGPFFVAADPTIQTVTDTGSTRVA